MAKHLPEAGLKPIVEWTSRLKIQSEVLFFKTKHLYFVKNFRCQDTGVDSVVQE